MSCNEAFPLKLGIQGNRSVLRELDHETDAPWFKARRGKVTSQGMSGSYIKPKP